MSARALTYKRGRDVTGRRPEAEGGRRPPRWTPRGGSRRGGDALPPRSEPLGCRANLRHFVSGTRSSWNQAISKIVKLSLSLVLRNIRVSRNFCLVHACRNSCDPPCLRIDSRSKLTDSETCFDIMDSDTHRNIDCDDTSELEQGRFAQ